MFEEFFAIIKANYEVITAISAVVFGISAAFVAIWIAYYSPQATQSKIEKKKYLKEKRNEHYKRLNQEIFMPLSKMIFLRRNNTSTNELQMLTLEFISFDETLLKKGINHLKIDSPEGFVEYGALHERVKNYNFDLQNLYDGLDATIRNEFDGILEVSMEYTPEQDFFILNITPIKKIILVLFLRYLGKIMDFDKELIQKNCKSAIISDINNHASVGFFGKRPFLIFGISVTNVHFDLPVDLKNPGQGMTQQFIEAEKSNNITQQAIIEHICSIASNESVFKKLKNILNDRNQLLETEKKLSIKFKQISESIDKGDYETIGECCTDKQFL
ncbi:MAG: hypothetical protein ABFC78_05720 [Methanoregula sp.]|jgi:hypothetical protein